LLYLKFLEVSLFSSSCIIIVVLFILNIKNI
jgi:hypothetical protein